MSNELQQHDEVGDADWLEFESLLGELAQLAKSGIPYDRLAKSLLDQTVYILAAVGGAVWSFDTTGGLRLDCQLNADALQNGPHHGDHQQLLRLAREEKEIVVVPPEGNSFGSKVFPNPTGFNLLIGPLTIDQDVVGLIELIQRPSINAAVARGNRRILGLICELASEHLRRQEVRKLRDERQWTRQFDEFTTRIHGTLDLQIVAYELVNAARLFIDCDRVSLAVRKGRRQEVVAISSVDSVNRTSNSVRSLESLAGCAAGADDTIWYDGANEDEIAPQILTPLRLYADEAHPRVVGLIPLHAAQPKHDRARPPVLGVLIVEQFDSDFENTRRERALRVAQQSELALFNALCYQALPTLPFARVWNYPVGRPAVRKTTMAAAVSGIGLLAASLFVPMDFNVYAEGKLQPQEQQHVFAPLDGQVVSILVKHGDHVDVAQELIELRSPDIDLERQRVQGEFDTTQMRIAAIESSLLQADASDDLDITRFNQLAGEQEELTQLLASQREQLSILREQREKLIVRSPIAGAVLTWDLEQSLADRPVQRGQLLATVANLQKPWAAELEVPDDRIGYILETKDVADPVRASFQLATNRGVDFQGDVSRIASRIENSDDGRPIVRVTLEIDELAVGELRPGATVFAKVHCGQRSAAFVLFHSLIESVQRWLHF